MKAINPATGELIKDYPEHSDADVVKILEETDEEFRRWLAEYAGQRQKAETALSVVRQMRKYVRTGGRRFGRDEMNER